MEPTRDAAAGNEEDTSVFLSQLCCPSPLATQESTAEASPTSNNETCVQLSQTISYSQLDEIEIPSTQESSIDTTPMKNHNSPKCDSPEAPPKRSKTTALGTGRTLPLQYTRATSWRKSLVRTLSFNDNMYSIDAVKLATGMAHLCGAPHATLYFSTLQSGLRAYNNNYLKTGPTLKLDVENQHILDQEISWIGFETNRMVRTMACPPKWVERRTDGQVQLWVNKRSTGQLRLIYVMFHLVKQLFGCAHRHDEIVDQDCFVFLEKLLLSHPSEKDCYQLMFHMVFAMETMVENGEFLTFIRNTWSHRYLPKSHRSFIDKLHSVSNSFDQDPELGQIIVDIWNLFHNRGKNTHILLGETRVSNLHHHNTIQVHAPWYFRRAVMAKALSMCMTNPCTKDSLKNSLDFFRLIVQLQKEENSDKCKRRRQQHVVVGQLGEIGEKGEPLDVEQWYLLKPLDEAEKMRYEAQLNRRDNDEKACRDGTVEAIKRLKGVVEKNGEHLIWLNSDPINYYFDQMAARERYRWDNGLTVGRCHCFKAFFYAQLTGIGSTKVFNYGNVRNFGRRCPGRNIFLLHKLLIPINQKNQHWMLSVVNFLEKSISIWDSYVQWNKDSHAGVANDILKYLKLEYFTIHKGTKPFSALGEWKLQSYRDVLKQSNGDDCGIFTIMHTDIILRHYSMSILRSTLEAEEKYEEIIRRCRDRLATMMLNEEQFYKD